MLAMVNERFMVKQYVKIIHGQRLKKTTGNDFSGFFFVEQCYITFTVLSEK